MTSPTTSSGRQKQVGYPTAALRSPHGRVSGGGRREEIVAVTSERAYEVANALASYAAARFSVNVTVEGEPSTAGEGMDNEVYFVTLAGRGLPAGWQAPLVVRVQPDVDRFDVASDEVRVQEWCATVDYPSPHVLAMLAPGELTAASAQVMARAPGVPMIDALIRPVWKAPALVTLLADLHVRLHQAPTDAWPLPEVSLARRRLRPVYGWVEALDDPLLREALARVEALLPYLEDHPAVACHGDFHPLNVMVDVPTMTGSVIDWTDAGLGDRHGDVARTQLLFRVAAIAASSPVERALLKVAGPRLASHYLRQYRKQLPLDEDRLATWEVVHLLHGWGQVRALHAGIIGRDRERDRVPAALAAWLHQRLQRRLDAAAAIARRSER
jgi:aminoglycoside phosphotransferase (APT) family kinase protein